MRGRAEGERECEQQQREQLRWQREVRVVEAEGRARVCAAHRSVDGSLALAAVAGAGLSVSGRVRQGARRWMPWARLTLSTANSGPMWRKCRCDE